MKKKRKRKKKYVYCVYVINLKRTVLKNKRFVAKNPEFIKGRPCVYVGQTVRTPQQRLKQHLSGYKASYFAKNFGIELRKNKCETGLKTRRKAEDRERELAAELRARGWGVWSN